MSKTSAVPPTRSTKRRWIGGFCYVVVTAVVSHFVSKLLDRELGDEYVSLSWQVMAGEIRGIVLSAIVAIVLIYAFAFTLSVVRMPSLRQRLVFNTLIIVGVCYLAINLVWPTMQYAGAYTNMVITQRQLLNTANGIYDSVDRHTDLSSLRSINWSGRIEASDDTTQEKVLWWDNYLYYLPMVCATFVNPRTPDDAQYDYGMAFQSADGTVSARVVLTTNQGIFVSLSVRGADWAPTFDGVRYRKENELADMRSGRKVDFCAVLDKEYIYAFVNGEPAVAIAFPYGDQNFFVGVVYGHHGTHINPGTEIQVEEFTAFLTERGERHRNIQPDAGPEATPAIWVDPRSESNRWRESACTMLPTTPDA